MSDVPDHFFPPVGSVAFELELLSIRIQEFRLALLEDAEDRGVPELLIRIGLLSERLLRLYQRAPPWRRRPIKKWRRQRH